MITPVSSPKTPSSRTRSVLRFFGRSAAFLLLIYGLLYAYDAFSGNNDGLIRGIAFRNIFPVIFWLTGILFVLSLGLVSRSKLIQNLSFTLLSTFLLLLLIEGIGNALVAARLTPLFPSSFHRFYLPADLQEDKPQLAGDYHPQVSRWRLPNSADTLKNCAGEQLIRTSNAYGAYDRPRTTANPTPGKKRVVLLGDSFLEGYLVPDSARLSNLLEAQTSREHLNFAINGTSPINYYLIYKHLAKPFDHDAVIIGLLPGNDFEDYDASKAFELIESPIYRPYWNGTYPNYQLKYSLANVGQSISRTPRTQEGILRTIDSVYAHLSTGHKLKANLLVHSSLLKGAGYLAHQGQKDTFTRFERFTDAEFNYIQYSLERIIEEASGKPVIILSIPIANDLKAMKAGRPNRFDPKMAAFCRQKGALFIPLTPYFSQYKGNLDDLFLSCDGHWTRRGEAFATQALLSNPIYRKAVGL